jgi:hypothetical protein
MQSSHRFSSKITEGLLKPPMLILLVLCGINAAGAQDYPTGLIPSKDLYEALPLEDPPTLGDEIPARFSLESDMPPVGNQGQQSSCTAWAVGYALKGYHEKVERSWELNTDKHLFSPSFIYNQINKGKDQGSAIVSALELLEQSGCCTLESMPYDQFDFKTRPSKEAREEAKKFELRSFKRVNHRLLNGIKRFIASGDPIVIGAEVDRSFMRLKGDEVWKDFENEDGQGRGLHAMIVVGYDDDKSAFLLQNSWGKNWGTRGCGWIEYEHFKDSIFEAYWCRDMIVKKEPDDPKQAKEAVDVEGFANNFMTAAVAVGRMPFNPTPEQIEEIWPNNLMPAEKGEREKFFKLQARLWEDYRKLALWAPVIQDFGEPEKQRIGDRTKYTFYPTFFNNHGNFQLTIFIEVDDEGACRGMGMRGGGDIPPPFRQTPFPTHR